MRLVTKWSDIQDNLNQLEKYRHSANPREVTFYQSLLVRGICFVVYSHKDERLFGPSRFIGYVRNDLDAHLANKSKDGRETNLAISTILDKAPTEDESLEREYRDFCVRIGLTPRLTGQFGIKRKYWLIS